VAVRLLKGLTAQPFWCPFGYLKGSLRGHFSGRSALKGYQNFDRQQKYVYIQTTKGRRAHVKSNGATHNQIHKQKKVAQRQARPKAAMC